MPPHTIRLPPPYRSCSTMAQFAYLSPLRRQTRRRLSSISSRSRDSSVKSTVAHCWLVHRRCCLVHASLACLCLWESGTPTKGRRALSPALWSRFRTVWTDTLVPVSAAEQLRERLSRTGTRVSVQTVGIDFTANCAIVEHDRYGGGSIMVPCSAAGWQRKTSSGEDSTAVPAAEQCGSSRLACSIPWLVANRACLGHSRQACTTESSTTKNAPSFGCSLAGGVEEDTQATDCQTHQEYASSLCGLHRCNRWTYAILTDLWSFIGDPSDLPYKFSHSHLVLQTPTDGVLTVNEMM